MAEAAQEKKPVAKIVTTPKFRVSYAFVFSPEKKRPGEEGKKDTWAVTAIFDTDADFKEMNALLEEARKKEFGTRTGGLKYPWREDSEYDLDAHPEYAGKRMCVLRSHTGAPEVFKNVKGYPKITNPKEFYSGCYANAVVSAFAYKDNPKSGMSFSLVSLLKVAEGEPLVIRSDPNRDFAGVPVGDESDFTTDNSQELEEESEDV